MTCSRASTNDVDTLSQSLNQGLIQLVTSVTQVVGVAIMMLTISVPLAGVTFVTLPVSALVLGVLIRRSRRSTSVYSRSSLVP